MVSSRNEVVYKVGVVGLDGVNFVVVSGAIASRDMRRAFSGCPGEREYSLPASCRVLEKSAFEMVWGPRGVSTVVCPEGLRRVGDNAFFCCESLRRVVFGDNSLLERVGSSAFAQSGLCAFAAPAGLKSIGRAAFHGCKRLEQVSLDGALEEVGPKCFAGTRIRSIAIPELVTELPEDTFLGCTALTTVEFAENSRLWRVGEEAFARTGLKAFRAPARLEQIGQCAFLDCKSLRRVELNEGLRAIGVGNTPANALDGRGVFGGSGLETVRLPSTLRELGPWAFAGTGLSSLELPPQVQRVGEGEFFSVGVQRPSCDSACAQSAFQSGVEASTSDSQASGVSEGFCARPGAVPASKLGLYSEAVH